MLLLLEEHGILNQNIQIQILVNNLLLARPSNCGNTLRALVTIFILKKIKRTQLIAGSNSNKTKDWAIRIQAPKFIMQEYGEGSETRWRSV